jgi:ankyrin repeat protein
MIPAGYERKSVEGYGGKAEKFLDSEDEDDEFEFDFCDSYAQLQFDKQNKNDTAAAAKQQTPSDVVNTEDITNNNDYYDDQTDNILDELKSTIIQRNLEAMKYLFETHQLDVNVCFKNDWIPLMYAASVGSWELCEYLIQIGADVFYSDGNA